MPQAELADGMERGEPSFSIVVPAYNYGHFLGETLQSLRVQQRDDLQIIVVDDASTDNTAEEVARFDGLVQYVRNESNLGAAGAWRKGIGLASGKYLIKLDADDQLLPGHLDAIERAFQANPEAAMVVSSVLLLEEDSGVTRAECICEEDQVLDAIEFRNRLLTGFFFRMPGCALRMEFLKGHEGPDAQLFQIHDWEYFLRVTRGHQAVQLSLPTAVYREHVSSVSATTRNENRLMSDISRWLQLACTPGEHYLEEQELKTLHGSLAILLITGFGKPSSFQAATTLLRNYLKAVPLAARGGFSQLIRLHSALAKKTLKTIWN